MSWTEALLAPRLDFERNLVPVARLSDVPSFVSPTLPENTDDCLVSVGEDLRVTHVPDSLRSVGEVG